MLIILATLFELLLNCGCYFILFLGSLIEFRYSLVLSIVYQYELKLSEEATSQESILIYDFWWACILSWVFLGHHFSNGSRHWLLESHPSQPRFLAFTTVLNCAHMEVFLCMSEIIETPVSKSFVLWMMNGRTRIQAIGGMKP